MSCCSSYNCSNRGSGKNKKKLYRFPHNRPELLQRWVINMKRANWEPKKHSMICQDHFEDSCFDKTGQTWRLRESDHDYSDIPNVITLSEFSENAVGFISGYVVEMVENRLKCELCKSVLRCTEKVVTSYSKLLLLKDRGALIFPSHDVVKVTKETEKCVKRVLACTNGRLPNSKSLVPAICSVVLQALADKPVFNCLESHMFDTSGDNNHLINLIRLIAECYLKIRMYHLGKKCVLQSVGESIRSQMNRLVIFRHQ